LASLTLRSTSCPEAVAPKAPLVLAAEDREVLLRWTRRPNSSNGLAQRARILLRCADGRENDELGAGIGCCELTDSFNEHRAVSGLVSDDEVLAHGFDPNLRPPLILPKHCQRAPFDQLLATSLRRQATGAGDP